MVMTTSEFNPTDYLETNEDIAIFLSEAFATEDYKHIAHCLGITARAKGMTNITKETRLAQEELQRSFSEEGDLTLKNAIVIMHALGVNLTATTRYRKKNSHSYPQKIANMNGSISLKKH